MLIYTLKLISQPIKVDKDLFYNNKITNITNISSFDTWIKPGVALQTPLFCNKSLIW